MFHLINGASLYIYLEDFPCICPVLSSILNATCAPSSASANASVASATPPRLAAVICEVYPQCANITASRFLFYIILHILLGLGNLSS